MNKTAEDSQGRSEASAFEGVLQERGWKLRENLQIEYRWGGGDSNRYRAYAAELVAQAPDVLLAVGGTIVGALQQVTRDVPIVFVAASDPVNRGLVATLSRPGGNTTGFTLFEYGISGKWLELLKEIVPRLARAAVIRDPSEFSGIGELAAIQAVAPSLRVELTPVDVRDTGAIEHAFKAFANQPDGGLIVTESGTSIKQRSLITTLASRHRVPAIYANRYFVTGGGLISYGPDELDQF
jgi:putative ABC transport system substrate-binding protein